MQLVRTLGILCLFALSACSSDPSAKSGQAEENPWFKHAGVGLISLRDPDSSFFVFEDESFTKYLGHFSLGDIVQDPDINPKYFDLSRQLCYFTCLGWNARLYKVLLNEEDGSIGYIPIDTSLYRVIHWDQILKDVTFYRTNPSQNRARTKPSVYGTLLEWDTISAARPLTAMEVEKQWALVPLIGDSLYGWIRWVHYDTLFLNMPPQNMKRVEEWSPFVDPTTNPKIYR